MAIQTTYTQARANLKKLLDHVDESREAVIIHRRNGKDVALISAQELSGLLETIHLLRSPNNARRLLESLERSSRGKGKRQTIQQIRAEYGLDDDE
jgi:antitoxin YefM